MDEPGVATRDMSRAARWIRLRVGVVSTAIILLGMVALDFILAILLPVPPAVAGLARADVLHFGPVAIGVALLTVWLELRSVSRVCRTRRLGLRPSEEERLRALRAARSFPMELASMVLLAATFGNVVTTVFDLQGRSPTVWHSLHVATVAECVVAAFAAALFLHARQALREIVRALSRPGDPLVSSLGLRGRVGVMVGGLAAVAVLPGASYVSLQRDARQRRLALARQERVAVLLARQAERVGIDAMSQRWPAAGLPDGSRAFYWVAGQEPAPAHLGRTVRRASLPAPRAPRVWVRPLGIYQHVVARGVSLPDGRRAWVGVVTPRKPARGSPDRLLFLVVALMAVSLLVGLLLGAGLAAEARALAGRVASLAAREPPEPLPPEVGSVSELGAVVGGVNTLLAAAGRSEVERYVAAEHVLEKTQTRTQILANMSHDLKAPLTSILGFVELLQAETSGRLSPAQKERMAVVAQGGRALRNLLDVLLDAAKLDVGRLRLERAWTPPATLASRAMNRLAEVAGEAVRQQVRVEVQPGLSPIYVDAARTASAIAQLLALLRAVARSPASGAEPTAVAASSPTPGASESPTAVAASSPAPGASESPTAVAASSSASSSSSSAAVAASSPSSSSASEPLFSLRVRRYTTRGDRGVEIVVSCRDTGSVDPTRIDLLAVLDDPDASVPSRVPRFRPGAELARKILGRQRARIEPFHALGGSGTPDVANNSGAPEGTNSTGAPDRASIRASGGDPDPRPGRSRDAATDHGSGYRIRFSFATTGEIQAVAG